MIKPQDTVIATLGEPKHPSPLRDKAWGKGGEPFVSDGAKVRYQVELGVAHERPADVFFEIVGPRSMLFFNPRETRAAIVTCGGNW